MSVVDQGVLDAFQDNPDSEQSVVVHFEQMSQMADFHGSTQSIDGATVKRALGTLPFTIMTVTFAALQVLQSDPKVARVELNKKIRLFLNTSVPAIGITPVWLSHGYTGRGIRIAILDSGVDVNHPDLVGRVTAANFTADPDAGDHVGHGTHVASIAAGSGNASGGLYKGVAPGALIYSGKVVRDDQSGDMADALEGLDWAITQGCQVINCSFGLVEGGDGKDAFTLACNQAVGGGAVVVAAAGNSGPTAGTIASPASGTRVIAVGAVDDAGAVASFSSRGPTGDGRVKPDVVAPGVAVTAARASGTTLGPVVGTQYVTLQGTSMAAPHVAGLCALIREARPTLSGLGVKNLLMSEADPLIGIPNNTQGSGRADALSAYMWLRESMTIRLSSGFRAAWMSFAGFQALMQYGVIEVYSGNQPATADSPPTGTLLARITQDGLPFTPKVVSGGLFLTIPEIGAVALGGNWVLKGLATGVAGWFRWKWNGHDAGSFATNIPRIDGSIPADLLLETASITPTTEFPINVFKVIQPSH